MSRRDRGRAAGACLPDSLQVALSSSSYGRTSERGAVRHETGRTGHLALGGELSTNTKSPCPLVTQTVGRRALASTETARSPRRAAYGRSSPPRTNYVTGSRCGVRSAGRRPRASPARRRTMLRHAQRRWAEGYVARPVLQLAVVVSLPKYLLPARQTMSSPPRDGTGGLVIYVTECGVDAI